MRRLAHAELSLHALVSSARDTTGTAGAKRSAALGTELSATMMSIAAQIRSVRSPHGGADDDMARVIERLSDVAAALEDIVADPVAGAGARVQRAGSHRLPFGQKKHGA